jgi:hypothetical protein
MSDAEQVEVRGHTLDPLLQLYLDKGCLVFPWAGRRTPLVPGGFHGASNDARLVASWQQRWPRALWSIATGRPPQGSGIAIADLDRKNGKDGFATLAELPGSSELPPVPRVHTPSGDGRHLWFLAPPNECGSTVGDKGKRWRGPGPGIDIKCDRGSCHVPGGSPASPYRWDPEFNLETALLLPLPAVLTPVELPDVEDETLGPTEASEQRPAQALISAYAKARLAGTLDRIRRANPGEQRYTLNGEAYAIARVAAALGLDRQELIEDLVEAGLAMQQEAGKPPWRRHGVDGVQKTVVQAVGDGMKKPKTPRLRSWGR